MHVTMVKKRLLNGEPCKKCVDAETKMKTLQASFTLRQETGTDTRSPGNVWLRAESARRFCAVIG